MAKIVFKFFEANVEDDEVSPFLKKIEEVLKRFSGDAYHFRYLLDEPVNTTGPKNKKSASKDHNDRGYRTNRV